MWMTYVKRPNEQTGHVMEKRDLKDGGKASDLERRFATVLWWRFGA